MLDPDYLNQAGDMVCSAYSEIETEMLTYLCTLLLDQDAEDIGQHGMTALNLLAQSHGPELMRIIQSHQGDVNEAIERTVSDAIDRNDRADAKSLGVDPGLIASSRSKPQQVSMTAQGIAAILERDNVEMAQGALDLWNRCIAEATVKVNTGSTTAERAIHGAVRRMMREGITTITYRDPTTGKQTITNHIDVAVRRHVRTQIAQDGMRRTLDICGQSGVQLVEVSSHGGARPSHARWQGRVYSLNGEVEIDGVRYKDFYEETGYGKVDGLGGANCRHSFGPWRPGTPRMYDPEPKHPSGLDNDEIYALTQEQRRRERSIRQTKRELKGAQLIADKDASLANIAEVERLKSKLRRQQESMRSFIDEANAKGKADVLQRSPNREWAGDMPRIRKSSASHRTMKEFMDSDGVKRAIKAHGVSKATARRALSEEMTRRGVSSRDFSMLSKSNQQFVFKAALTRRKPTERELRRAKMKPVNEALYNSQKNYVERHGGIVMRGDEEVERWLDMRNADALTYGDVIMLHSDANTSEVLEEVYHFQQEQRGDYSEYDEGIKKLLRERDAQRYLLSVSERYNIPKDEVSQTERALDEYLRLLKEAGYDEGD